MAQAATDDDGLKWWTGVGPNGACSQMSYTSESIDLLKGDAAGVRHDKREGVRHDKRAGVRHDKRAGVRHEVEAIYYSNGVEMKGSDNDV